MATEHFMTPGNVVSISFARPTQSSIFVWKNRDQREIWSLSGDNMGHFEGTFIIIAVETNEKVPALLIVTEEKICWMIVNRDNL